MDSAHSWNCIHLWFFNQESIWFQVSIGSIGFATLIYTNTHISTTLFIFYTWVFSCNYILMVIGLIFCSPYFFAGFSLWINRTWWGILFEMKEPAWNRHSNQHVTAVWVCVCVGVCVRCVCVRESLCLWLCVCVWVSVFVTLSEIKVNRLTIHETFRYDRNFKLMIRITTSKKMESLPTATQFRSGRTEWWFGRMI